MVKININGQDYIKVRNLREEIRWLRRNIPVLYNSFSKAEQAMVHLAYNDIIRAIYREELELATTPEEIRAIHEMPGDFVVGHTEGKGKDKKLKFFKAWEDGEATFTDAVKAARWFNYESKAEEIASALNEKEEGWHVFDMSPEERERNHKLLKFLFGEDE